MRSFNFQRVLSAALESFQGFGFVTGVELRALTITGREVAMPITAMAENRHAGCSALQRAATAVGRAWRKAVGRLPGVVAAPRNCPRSGPAKTCVC
jgi:hypothetical protein